MPNTIADYVSKRAELLANVALTRQMGAQVLRFQDPKDGGTDLVVQLPPIGDVKTGAPILPRFGVEVMGTDESLETEEDATDYVQEHGKERSGKGFFLGPVVLMLFSMNGDKGYYSWIMEPRVTKTDGPTLARVHSPTMTRITKPAIEHMFRESREWFQAMMEMLLRDKKDK